MYQRIWSFRQKKQKTRMLDDVYISRTRLISLTEPSRVLPFTANFTQKLPSNDGTAAIYCRLSKDDEQIGESVSIEKQKMLLTDYCVERGYLIQSIMWCQFYKKGEVMKEYYKGILTWIPYNQGGEKKSSSVGNKILSTNSVG